MSEVASHRDPEVLESLYWEKEMSLSEIAEELGVTAPTIHYQMNKHGVETRTIEKDRRCTIVPPIERQRVP